jgi:hypothetical protein
MQRTRVKGYWVRQSSSPATEPDFYAMSYVHPELDGIGSAKAHTVSTGSHRMNHSMEQRILFDDLVTRFDTPDTRSSFDHDFPHSNVSHECGKRSWYSPVHIDRHSNASHQFTPMGASCSNQADGDTNLSRSSSQSANQVFDFTSTALTSRSYVGGVLPFFSSTERHDIANFLSDVDLESDEEVSATYRNEVEFGRISRKEFAHAYY